MNIFYEDGNCIIYQPVFNGKDWVATALDKTDEYKGEEWELYVPGHSATIPPVQKFLDVLEFKQTWSSTAWDDADWASEGGSE